MYKLFPGANAGTIPERTSLIGASNPKKTTILNKALISRPPILQRQLNPVYQPMEYQAIESKKTVVLLSKQEIVLN